MAQKEHLLAAVDIGTTKIVSIVGKQTENKKLEILGMSRTDSKGVKRGVVLNIEETVNAIHATVTEVRKQTGLTFENVFVGIAGQHIKSVRNRGYFNRDSYDDEITKADIERLVDDMYKIPIDAGEEIIHVIPQNFVVDSETGIKNPVGISGKRLEGNFHIVIGQIASAKNISKCINRVGLNVEELILEPLASSESVLTEDEKEAGVALVDIGGGTTDIAVYHDDILLHTAVIPFGGNVVTKDIKDGCSILNRQAESLKIMYGSALGDLAQGIARAGIRVSTVFVRQLEPIMMRHVPRDDSTLKVFIDLGAGQQNLLEEHGLGEDEVVIIDHHVSQEAEIPGRGCLELDPPLVGVERWRLDGHHQRGPPRGPGRRSGGRRADFQEPDRPVVAGGGGQQPVGAEPDLVRLAAVPVDLEWIACVRPV